MWEWGRRSGVVFHVWLKFCWIKAIYVSFVTLILSFYFVVVVLCHKICLLNYMDNYKMQNSCFFYFQGEHVQIIHSIFQTCVSFYEYFNFMETHSLNCLIWHWTLVQKPHVAFCHLCITVTPAAWGLFYLPPLFFPHVTNLNNKAGNILYFSYCQQITVIKMDKAGNGLIPLTNIVFVAKAWYILFLWVTSPLY